MPFITLGEEVVKGSRLLDLAVAVSLVAVPLAGCAGPQQPGSGNTQSFDSIEDAYAAVDAVLGCDAAPAGDPIVPISDGIALASAQRLCSTHVQIDLYPDEKALETSYQMWSDSIQGQIPLVRGANWMVVDLSRLAGNQPSRISIERLAEQLNGEYAVVGT
ncbi:MAG: hypothetical protein ACLGH7_02970 [Actinomycetes bacterium]